MYHPAFLTKKYKRRQNLRHNADTDMQSNLGTRQHVNNQVATNMDNASNSTAANMAVPDPSRPDSDTARDAD
jgi:hypothetical protein